MNNINPDTTFSAAAKQELVFTGDLKIQNANNILNEMQNSFANGVFNIRIKEISSLDLTFIQLLYAYCKTAAQQKINIHINWETSSEYESLIKNCGFEELFNQNWNTND